MPGTNLETGIVRFGDFEADLAAGQIRKRGLKLKLHDQSFAVLAILLEHAGAVVTRDEFRRRLWPKDVFVDFDNGLNTAVARLRDALGDSAGRCRFIQTLPKRGYRFIGDLVRAGPAAPRLLVLPFANLSGDPAQEYFADAVTEEIIGALAGLAPERLAVIARTTSMQYKGSRKSIDRIRSELAVDYIVEGSARCTNDRVIINVQLIQARDQTHLWTDRYDADARDIFTVESAAAEAIARQVGVAPLRATRKPTADLAAYKLYIQGRQHLYRSAPGDIGTAKDYLEQAIARDPNFALAYDGLAELFWYLGFFGIVPPKEACAAGMFHAIRALEIDPTLADTHALVAMYRKELDYNWAEVEREIKLALQLNPASPVVRLRYALSALMPHGHVVEAVAEIEGALDCDPLATFPRTWLAGMLWLARRYDEGIEQVRTVLELDANLAMAHYVLGMCHQEKGDFEGATAAHRRAVELSGGSPMMLGWLGLTLARSGNTAEARALLQTLHDIARQVYVPPTSYAWVHFGLGEVTAAFEWLDRAIDSRDPMMAPVKSYPFLEPIRSTAEYAALLRNMNLEP